MYISYSTLKMSSIEELLQKAKDEVAKVRNAEHMQKDEGLQKDAKSVLLQSVMFADNVLKRLVSLTVGEDVDDLFDTILPTRGSVLITAGEGESEAKYNMQLDIVDADYMLDLGTLKDSTEVRDRITFLLNTVKVLYNPIKDHMKKITAESDGVFNYVLQIGLNTTLFLDKDSKKRIGIIMNEVEEFPQTTTK